jgi:hypothetical protein
MHSGVGGGGWGYFDHFLLYHRFYRKNNFKKLHILYKKREKQANSVYEARTVFIHFYANLGIFAGFLGFSGGFYAFFRVPPIFSLFWFLPPPREEGYPPPPPPLRVGLNSLFWGGGGGYPLFFNGLRRF